jgi:uncharacterized RmlC-like cupin family protein
MAGNNTVRRITPAERVEGDPTPGMVREQAITTPGMWAGYVSTEEHAASGWHHHGDYDTAVFVVDGAIRMEFGPDGDEAFEAQPGDFIHVPKHVIHRESNPTDGDSHVVVVRAGSGPPTINVDGPEPQR